jgi:hypothetical protein
MLVDDLKSFVHLLNTVFPKFQCVARWYFATFGCRTTRLSVTTTLAGSNILMGSTGLSTRSSRCCGGAAETANVRT